MFLVGDVIGPVAVQVAGQVERGIKSRNTCSTPATSAWGICAYRAAIVYRFALLLTPSRFQSYSDILSTAKTATDRRGFPRPGLLNGAIDVCLRKGSARSFGREADKAPIPFPDVFFAPALRGHTKTA
jgi:hypothetical protein